MKNKIKKIIAIISILFFASPVLVLAQGGGGTGSAGGGGGGGGGGSFGGSSTGGPINIPNPIKANNLLDLINDIVTNVVLPIGAVVCVMYIIYAGLTFVTAQGKPAEIEKAKQRLLWALMGTGILLGAVGISQAVQLTVKALFP